MAERFYCLINAMADVLKEFPNTKLLLVGQKGTCKQDLIQHCKNLNLHEVNIFSNNLPKETLLSYIVNPQIYVQPSLYEPLGQTILEAMSSGKPTIATLELGYT